MKKVKQSKLLFHKVRNVQTIVCPVKAALSKEKEKLTWQPASSYRNSQAEWGFDTHFLHFHSGNVEKADFSATKMFWAMSEEFSVASLNWKRQLLYLQWFMTDTFIRFMQSEKAMEKKWTTKSMQPFLRFHEQAWICLMTFSSTLLIRLCKGMPISVLQHLECLWKCPWKWMKNWLKLRGRREMEMEAESDRIFFMKD